MVATRGAGGLRSVLYTPLPDDGATPIHDVARVTLEPGQKGEIEFTPETSGSTHFVPTVAITKLDQATYTVSVDMTERFGPDAPAPPTDPDDLTTTFPRALELSRQMNVTIKDVRTTGSAREFVVHVVGWQE